MCFLVVCFALCAQSPGIPTVIEQPTVIGATTIKQSVSTLKDAVSAITEAMNALKLEVEHLHRRVEVHDEKWNHFVKE